MSVVITVAVITVTSIHNSTDERRFSVARREAPERSPSGALVMGPITHEAEVTS